MTPEPRLILLRDSVSALDEFKPEAELLPPSATAATSDVSLSELLAHVRMEWYEALAIVQALCRSIIDSGDQIGPTRVDFDDVFISAAGSITATCQGPRHAAAAVQCFGNILERLLPDHDFMFLKARLVSKATSSPPYYNSLQELSVGIAYYERPNRSEIIQSVYHRYYSRPAHPSAAPSNRQPVAAASLPDEQPRRAAARRTMPIRQATVFVIVAGVSLGVALATAVWMMQRPPRAAASASTENLLVDTEQPVPEQAVSEQPVSDEGRSADARRSIALVAMASQSERQGIGPERAIQGSPTPVRQEPPGLTRELEGVRFESRPGSAISPQPDVRFEEPPAPGAIYTDRDNDVIPPNIEYPRYSNEYISGAASPDRFTIEVVVNERGQVDMAKARSLPRTIGDSLFLMNTLSATKSWRFHPALKGMYPVKYRYFFALSRN